MNPKSPVTITLTQMMGPSEANIHGNVHGGLIMKLCDEAGAMAAMRYAQSEVVTVAVDSMSFLSPVHIGEMVTVTAEVTWTGRTSMEIRVKVTAEEVISGRITHTNAAYFVYVALASDGRPTPVPPLVCETPAEKLRQERAEQRRELRLKMKNAG
jgi:uncharacterized protein (TIGR00369 family)